MSDPYSHLEALGLQLISAGGPVGNFVPCVQVGNLVFLSGQGPRDHDGTLKTGKLGHTLSVEQGRSHAQLAGLNVLSMLHAQLGDLRRVRRIVRVLGMVNAIPDFEHHPAVINGASDLFVAVFDEAGRHSRTAVGMASLPFGISVEIEAIVEVSTPLFASKLSASTNWTEGRAGASGNSRRNLIA